MEWPLGLVIALSGLALTVGTHLVAVTWLLAKIANRAKSTEQALSQLEGRMGQHLERIYGKLDAFAVSQTELSELRGVVEGLRDRLRRVEGRQDARTT